MPESVSPNKAESQMTLASSRSVPDESHTIWYKKKRTSTEKLLLLAIFVAVFVVIALGLSLAVVTSGFNGAKARLEDLTASEGDVCLSKVCVRAAADILTRLDETVDPCDDFYKFACGNFEKAVMVPEEKSSVTQFSKIQDKLQEQLRILVEENLSTNDTQSTTLVKKLYRSCMNTERIEAQQIQPLQSILTMMGGWPVAVGPSWDESRFQWTQTVYNNRKIGYSVDYLVDFSVTIDVKNSSWRIIDLDQPPLGMPSRRYLLKGLNDSYVKAYLNYQVNMAVMLGADEEVAEKELTESLLFEMKIANFSIDNEERRDINKLYNKMTIKELTVFTEDIPWLEYMRNLLPDTIELTEDEPVIVNVPEYLFELAELLRTTPKRTVANYLMWRVVAASVGYLSNDIRDVQLQYSKKMTGKPKRSPRWKECLGAVSGSLSHAVGALYAKNFFKLEAKRQAEKMVFSIKKQFDNILRTVDWMDEETRSLALKKSRKVVAHIGYPEEILVDKNLQDLYRNLLITEGDLLDNMRNITIFGTDFSFGELRKKVDKHHWRNHGAAAVVNAFYSPLENSIQLPAGILQGVFYEADRPKYLNYGGIGFVIGHEITHGFDDKGRQFDEEGNVSDWWAKATLRRFTARSKCMIYQYGNYTEPQTGLKINGINTIGENIADNGGIKEAYEAYNHYVSVHGEEPKLPGLPYSPKQLFWISSAHVWCSKYRPESMKLRIRTGSHSPVQFRVNGPLRNIPDFSSDWRCGKDSKMNPPNKCTVW